MKLYSQRPAYDEIYAGIDVNNISLKYYDSISAMLLALDRGEIDSITVPRPVGRYILEHNKDLDLKGLDWWGLSTSSTLNFGFLSHKLAQSFNSALRSMNEDGTLLILAKKYIEDCDTSELSTLETFNDAETITVALTGDMPPIDYVDASGVPAGFNTAVLREIGKRLHVNIKTINIETGARMLALTSGQADVIFWFRGTKSSEPEITIADRTNGELILSEPYYTWNEQYFISKGKWK